MVTRTSLSCVGIALSALAFVGCSGSDAESGDAVASDASPVLLHCPPGEAPACTLIKGKNVCVCEPIVYTPPACSYGLSAAPRITGSYWHTCALAPDATARCWGLQPGSGVEETTATVHATSAKAIAGGGNHDCVVSTSGAVNCWGANDSGQLGDGTHLDHLTPAPVLGISDATLVAAGYKTTCALHASGTVGCWGKNESGQLGNGTTTDSASPVDVVGISNAVAIGVSSAFDGGTFACALLGDGSVRCWGGNTFGQLGNGVTGAPSSVPTRVSSLSNVVGISVGFYTACAVDCFGQAWCWGYNAYGEVGDGTTLTRSSPVAISVGAEVTAVSSGDASCALRVDGSMACWGPNTWGALGTGDTVSYATPHVVPGLTGVTTIDAQNYRTCAGKADGSVYCWGTFESLGDGTTSARLSPTRVIGIP